MKVVRSSNFRAIRNFSARSLSSHSLHVPIRPLALSSTNTMTSRARSSDDSPIVASIIVPCYKEAANITPLTERVFKALEKVDPHHIRSPHNVISPKIALSSKY